MMLATLLLAFVLQVLPQDAPKPKQGTYAVTNARIETVTGGVIERGTILVERDRIVAVGADVTIPPGTEIVDAAGLHVYPGLIDSGTRLGLTEIGSVDETTDAVELGDITPQMDALSAINPNSALIPVTRVAGVTTVLAEPSGGTLPGMAAMINLVGYTAEQMAAGARVMVMDFPTWPSARPRFGGGGARGGAQDDPEKTFRDALKRVDEIFDRAELYARIDSTWAAGKGDREPEFVPEMRALLPVVRGQMKLMIRVNQEKEIREALAWVSRRGYRNVVFSGLAEGWRVAGELAAAGFPCIVGPVLSVPTRESDRFDRAYANAGLLAQAGVKVAIRTGEAENVRNLPFNAGFAAAYGLGREEALKAVTIHAAEAFGIEGDYGSIEVGKKANFLVSTGDPFETATEIREVFIDGFRVPIDSRQIQLYREFLDRDEGRVKAVEIVPPVRN